VGALLVVHQPEGRKSRRFVHLTQAAAQQWPFSTGHPMSHTPFNVLTFFAVGARDDDQGIRRLLGHRGTRKNFVATRER
jgi:hypothetical protein